MSDPRSKPEPDDAFEENIRPGFERWYAQQYRVQPQFNFSMHGRPYTTDHASDAWITWREAQRMAFSESSQICASMYTGLGGPPDDPHPDAIIHNGAINDCVTRIRAVFKPY